MSAPTGKILIVRGGAIGDFILTLPVFTALRSQLPQAHLEVLGYGQVTRLAQAGRLVDGVRSIEARPLAAFFAHDGDLAPEWCDYFAGFAIIISFLYDPDGIFQANVARCSKAQFIAGPHRPDETAVLHATETFLKPLERLAIFDADPVPRLPLNPQRSAHNSPTIALHPGSGSERKNWPEPRWRELVELLLKETSQSLLLIGGEAEGDRLQRLATGLPESRLQLADRLPLLELAGRLSQCAQFIGHDSGISHLAAALGLPVLALWNESVEAVWRPQGDNVRVLRSPSGIVDLSAVQVLRELQAAGRFGRTEDLEVVGVNKVSPGTPES